MDTIIAPHGGRLVNRMAADAERAGLMNRAGNMPAISLNARQRSDVDLMAVGALSPLEGFMVQADYQRVLQEMRLASGAVWAVPVTLDADAEAAERAKGASDVGARSQRSRQSRSRRVRSPRCAGSSWARVRARSRRGTPASIYCCRLTGTDSSREPSA